MIFDFHENIGENSIQHLHHVHYGDVDVVWRSRIHFVAVADELVPILLLRNVVVVHGNQAEREAFLN